MKTFLILALGLGVAFGVTGCGGNNTAGGGATEARTPVPSNDPRVDTQ